MRELVYAAAGKIEWRETAEPRIESAETAIIRPIAATTCDLDTFILRGGMPFEAPFAIGHAGVAEVVDVGSGVSLTEPGDVVVVPWHVNCGHCQRCRAGLQAHCSTVPYGAMYGLPVGGTWGGLFSDLVAVPFADAMLVPLPDDLDPVAMASAGDNWPLAWRLITPHLTARPGARVLVMGRGSIGLYVCDIARAGGASEVLYVDPNVGRRAVAESFGARTAAAISAVHHGFEVAVDCTGDTEALSTALRSLVPEGFCESAGNHFDSDELPLMQMYVSGATLRIARDNARAHLVPALELARSGAVDPGRLVSGPFGWDDLLAELPEGHTKPVFVRERVTARTAKH